MTKTIKANDRYRSEKSIAVSFDMQAIAGSGNNWEKGREDFIGKKWKYVKNGMRKHDPRMGQSKSVGRRNAITVRYLDLFQLWNNTRKAGKSFPIFVLEYEHPSVTDENELEQELPEKERWVAMPEADYKLLWDAFVQLNFFTSM